MSDVHLMLAITERGKMEKFVCVFMEHHVYVVDCLLGEGTATSEVLDYLSLEDSEKALLLAIVTGDTLKPAASGFYGKIIYRYSGKRDRRNHSCQQHRRDAFFKISDGRSEAGYGE